MHIDQCTPIDIDYYSFFRFVSRNSECKKRLEYSYRFVVDRATHFYPVKPIPKKRTLCFH